MNSAIPVVNAELVECNETILPVLFARANMLQSSDFQGSWLASSIEIELDTKWGGFKNVFGDEGGFLIRCSGTGKIVAFAADHASDGGGLANFSANVATVAANAALGAYYAPKSDVTTYCFHSRGVTAGSMRGYGTVQTMTPLEVMVDEICAALPLDPIEFRRRNALQAGWRTMAGNPYIASVRTPAAMSLKHWRWTRAWGAGHQSLRPSVGSTEASNGRVARVGVVGPTRAKPLHGQA